MIDVIAVAIAIAIKNEKIKGVIVAVLDDSRARQGGGQARPSPGGNRPRSALYYCKFRTFSKIIVLYILLYSIVFRIREDSILRT